MPFLVAMGKRFFEASGYSDITQYDPDSTLAAFEMLLRDGVLLVVVKHGLVIGMAGAVLYPFYFNRNHVTSQEMFWWVDTEHRGVGKELFSILKQEVKKRGAMSLSMIALESLSPERVGAFYVRNGLRPSERSYIGKLV